MRKNIKQKVDENIAKYEFEDNSIVISKRFRRLKSAVWTFDPQSYTGIYPKFKCSNCGHTNTIESNYCPFCGCKMEKLRNINSNKYIKETKIQNLEIKSRWTFSDKCYASALLSLNVEKIKKIEGKVWFIYEGLLSSIPDGKFKSLEEGETVNLKDIIKEK